MKYKGLLSLLCAVVLLSACASPTNNDMPQNMESQKTAESDSTSSEEATNTPTASENTEAAISAAISPLATENFLLPLEDYSWEREFPAEYVMLHFTSAVVNSGKTPYDMTAVRKIFEESEISIHYIIDREGKIQCYIPETRAAWHAGRGSFAGDDRLTNAMNKYSIGIEILAIGSEKDMAQYLTSAEYKALPDSLIGFTDTQYESLSALTRDICERNKIPFDREHVIGHDMYNPAKNDPGELFLWDKLFGE